MRSTRTKQAWLAPFAPAKEQPWDRAAAAHLLRRAALAHPPEWIERALELGPQKAAAWLVAGEEPDSRERSVLAARRHAVANESADDLAAWWWARLLVTRHPLQARLGLFWHDHFATSIRKVRSTYWMSQQLAIFDDFGLGRFGELLVAVSKSPAMLRWLDNVDNKKGAANENFARELFELFALGRDQLQREGHSGSRARLYGLAHRPRGLLLRRSTPRPWAEAGLWRKRTLWRRADRRSLHRPRGARSLPRREVAALLRWAELSRRCARRDGCAVAQDTRPRRAGARSAALLAPLLRQVLAQVASSRARRVRTLGAAKPRMPCRPEGVAPHRGTHGTEPARPARREWLGRRRSLDLLGNLAAPQQLRRADRPRWQTLLLAPRPRGTRSALETGGRSRVLGDAALSRRHCQRREGAPCRTGRIRTSCRPRSPPCGPLAGALVVARRTPLLAAHERIMRRPDELELT